MALAIRPVRPPVPGSGGGRRARPPRPGWRPRAAGLPSWLATRATSSNSGLARPLVTFMRMTMPSTVTCSSARATGQRSTARGADPHGPGHPLDLGALHLDERGVGQDVQDVAGPALLHGDRAHPGVERAGLEGGGDGVSELLARHVVEVRLEQERRLPGTDRGSADTPADDDLGAVRQVVHLTGAPAEARGGDRHVREGSERGGQRGQQRGAGGRRELDPDVAAVGGDPLEQADRRRSRIGQPAVRAADRAHPRGHRRGADLVDAEHLERGSRPDDVDDRIVPADLVEVDLVDGTPVQGGFHRGQLVEDGLRAGRHPRRAARPPL